MLDLISMLLGGSVYHFDMRPPEPQVIEEFTKEEIVELVDIYADRSKIDRELLHYIVFKESSYNPKAIGDTHITCPKTGELMTSKGIAQISDCYWNFSDELKYDPYFSLGFLTREINKGNCHYWTTCRNYYKKELAMR